MREKVKLKAFLVTPPKGGGLPILNKNYKNIYNF